MGPRRRTQARVSIVCRRPPVPHAPNELDDPFAVAVDRFGTAYIADLAGLFQRITCASPATALSRVHMPARSPESPATRKTTSISPTLNTAWYGGSLPRRRPAGEAATPSLAYAAFINAASLLTFDARFISPLLPYAQIFGTAPGEMVRIRGACLCRFDPTLSQYDSTGTVPTTSVYFDQTAAPLILAQAGEIWAVVPATIAGQSSNVTIRSKRISEHCYGATRTYRLRAEAA